MFGTCNRWKRNYLGESKRLGRVSSRVCNNAVAIKEHFGKGGSQTVVSLLLYNDKGEEIDGIWTGLDYVEFCSLHHLYEYDKRACLKVDGTLDEMLAVLK